MKKLKSLALVSMSLFLLTSCYDDVHRDIESEIRFADIVTDPTQQNLMIEIISKAKIGARENNSHALSVDIKLRVLNLVNNTLAGYGYYNYNNETDKATFNLDVSGVSNLKVLIDEDQKLEANLKIANFDLINYENVQLNYDAKPLNELIDFSFLINLDESMIKEYRKTRYVDFDSFGRGFLGYVFVLDANKLNDMLNINFKFNSDPVLTILSDSYSFKTIEIIHLSGEISLSQNFNAGVKVFIYNVNPNN